MVTWTFWEVEALSFLLLHAVMHEVMEASPSLLNLGDTTVILPWAHVSCVHVAIYILKENQNSTNKTLFKCNTTLRFNRFVGNGRLLQLGMSKDIGCKIRSESKGVTLSKQPEIKEREEPLTVQKG